MALIQNATQAEKNAHYRLMLMAYADAVNRDDLGAIMALYADNAEVEDPIGGSYHFTDLEGIRGFYQAVVNNKVRMKIAGPIVGSKSNVAVMPITVTANGFDLNVISVAYFNEQGLIQKYNAHWGPGDYPEDINDPAGKLKW